MRPKLAILVSFSGQGGVERMIANLSQSLAMAPIDLDILLIKAKGPHIAALPDSANVMHLRARHTATSIFEVARYLRREKPDALLAIKHRGMIAALQARTLARTSTPISGRLGPPVSAALANKSSRRRARWFSTMRRYYPKLHRLIAVSQGVADDVITITGMSDRQVTVVRNPTVSPAMLAAATLPVEHPWLATDALPVVLGVGRLTEQKDFPTLLRAFAEAAKQRDARLTILGEGQLREALLEQARQLGMDAPYRRFRLIVEMGRLAQHAHRSPRIRYTGGQHRLPQWPERAVKRRETCATGTDGRYHRTKRGHSIDPLKSTRSCDVG